MSWRTTALASSPLWTIRTEGLPLERRVQLSYERSKSVLQAYKLTANDILDVSPKYWEFHTDPILSLDVSVGILLTIQYNLVVGTLAKYSANRPELSEIIQKLLNFELSGQFCLTEVGHGLDVINMTTTATLLPDGGFEIDTPTPSAAKFMPPTNPCGTPVVGIVFARLIVDGEDRGVKPFLVNINDGTQMCRGVECKILPQRGGAHPVQHSITYFDRVRLPPTALLSSPDKAGDARAAFFDNISRVMSGCLSMGALSISSMRIISYVAGTYSLRRHVIDSSTRLPRAIITFSTSYIPILSAVAQTFVMDAFANEARALYQAFDGNLYKQHFIAALFKAGIIKLAQSAALILGERCGAQGLMEINQISVLHGDLRGAAIAEGELLTTCIRFAIEVLLGRMTPAATSHPDSILAKHENSMINELHGYLASTSNHRDSMIERLILPHCQPLMESICYRMAYDVAVREKVDPRLIDLFVASIIKLDPVWYSENAGIKRSEQARMEEAAAYDLLPDLPRLLEGLNVKEYITAPIVSDEAWDSFIDSLATLKRREAPDKGYRQEVMSRL